MNRAEAIVKRHASKSDADDRDREIEQLLTPTVPAKRKPRPARLWPGISNRQYREAAKAQHHVEGEVEVDDRAKVSRSDDGGAYIMAWVWVDNADAEATQRKVKP